MGGNNSVVQTQNPLGGVGSQLWPIPVGLQCVAAYGSLCVVVYNHLLRVYSSLCSSLSTWFKNQLLAFLHFLLINIDTIMIFPLKIEPHRSLILHFIILFAVSVISYQSSDQGFMCTDLEFCCRKSCSVCNTQGKQNINIPCINTLKLLVVILVEVKCLY